MPRNILEPEVINRIKATCSHGTGEKPATYYFKDADELQKLTQDTPSFRCSMEVLPIHRAYIDKFKPMQDIQPGDYYLSEIGRDDAFVYSAELYVVEKAPSPLLSKFELNNRINRYLIKLNTKPAMMNDSLYSVYNLTISMLNDDGVETYMVVSVFLTSLELGDYLISSDIKEVIKKYAHVFYGGAREYEAHIQ